MFTGIVQSLGEIQSMQQGKGSSTLRIRPLGDMGKDPLSEGESISVNGVCLTICKLMTVRGSKHATGSRSSGQDFEVYASTRTLSCTNLSKISHGTRVNLERALRIGSRIGGHLVQGHVDTVGQVVSKRTKNNSLLLSISIPGEWSRYLVPNGSIAIDGVSLTVAAIKNNRLEVSLIPYTLEATTLETLKTGASVNLEVDIIGKYLIHGARL
jgi:riboflavin synthase